MKKIILLASVLISILACSSNDDDNTNSIDCSAVDCEPGAPLSILFTRNDDSTVTNADAEINILFEDVLVDEEVIVETTSFNQELFLFVSEASYIISIGEQELELVATTTFRNGECCPIQEVVSLSVEGIEVCNDLDSCSGVVEINIDSILLN